jgi:hypothetical protein
MLPSSSVGGEVELARHRLRPLDVLAGVGRHASHDRRQRALGDAFSLVEVGPVALDARHQVDALLHVGVGLLALPLPRPLAEDPRAAGGEHLPRPLVPMMILLDRGVVPSCWRQ